MRRWTVLVGVLLALGLAACGDPATSRLEGLEATVTTHEDGAPTGRTPAESIVPAERDDPAQSLVPAEPIVTARPGEPAASTVPPPATGPVALAVEDLAARLGIDRADIGLVSAEEVTWRDGAAGCPQPGMAYIQVLTNGSRIRLAAGEAVYQYHTRGAGDPFLCADPEEPLSSGGGFGDS